MEDILDLYEELPDAQYPTVCFDEKPVVLHGETRPTQPLAPGQPERRDYEYVREGTANLFVMVEPLAGWRHVEVTERRTRLDFAQAIRWLVEERYAEAQYIRIVLDNLNTHGSAALYEAFPAEQARAIAARVEWHHTPKHASWLNMAEIEISVFERGCLSRPVGDLATLERRVTALETERNEARCTIHWQFTSQHARTKLADLYPVIQTKLD
jgi:DDE superfamily endonuclease